MISMRARITRPAIKLAAAAITLLSAAAIAVLAAQWRSERRLDNIARAITGGDLTRASAIVRRFGCGGCHTIPGIGGADGQVAPSLAHLRLRVFIGGVARNTPENLVRWIVEPQALSPHSAMPPTGIGEADARDVAAYLYAQ
jgi:cytochrome c1